MPKVTQLPVVQLQFAYQASATPRHVLFHHTVLLLGETEKKYETELLWRRVVRMRGSTKSLRSAQGVQQESFGRTDGRAAGEGAEPGGGCMREGKEGRHLRAWKQGGSS